MSSEMLGLFFILGLAAIITAFVSSKKTDSSEDANPETEEKLIPEVLEEEIPESTDLVEDTPEEITDTF